MLVTGAAGFLGSFCVAEASRRGHDVVAMMRSASRRLPGWSQSVRVVEHDLRQPDGLATKIEGVDVVVHLAAAMAGTRAEQLESTVRGTEHLLAAMERAGIEHIVGISSVAVYDHLHAQQGSVLDESAVLEQHPGARHAYAEAKLRQELGIRDHCEQRGWRWTILRPGVVFGRGRLWTHRLGFRKGHWWLLVSGGAPVPLTYVENCAEAVVRACEAEAARGAIYNVVDGGSPRARDWAREIRPLLDPGARIVCLPWPLARAGAGGMRLLQRLSLRLLPAPRLLAAENLHAAFKPLRFSSSRIEAELGWSPTFTRAEALERCRAGGSARSGA